MEVRTKGTMSKEEIIGELEGCRDIIVDPSQYSTEGLAEKLRYHRCANCVEYESRKLCYTCTEEIVLG